MSLIFDFDEVEGVRTNEVTGKFTASEALQQLLSGTVLGFDRDVESGAFAVIRLEEPSPKLSPDQSSGNLAEQPNANPKQQVRTDMKKNKTTIGKLFSGLLSLAAASSTAVAQEDEQAVFELSPFSIDAESIAGYGVASLNSSTRLNTPIKEIPQTITVITEDFLEEIASTNFDEAVAYAPNVSNRANVPDGFTVRGFPVFNRFVNGFRVVGITASRDPINVQRLEVVKGPGSAVTGRGDVGGVVNTITKRPIYENGTDVTLKVGSNAFYRTEFDTYGPIGADGKAAYRLLFAYQNSGTDRFGSSFFNVDRRAIHPSFEWRPTDKTTINLDLGYQWGKEPSEIGTYIFSAQATLEAYDDVIHQRNPDGTLVFNEAGNAVRNPGYSGNLTANKALFDQFGHIENVYFDDVISRQEPWDERDWENMSAQAVITHEVNDWLTLRQAAYHETGDSLVEEVTFGFQNTPTGVRNPSLRDMAILRGIDPASLTHVFSRENAENGLFGTTRRFRQIDADSSVYRLQGDLLMQKDFEGIAGKHQLLIGYEYGEQQSDRTQYQAGMMWVDAFRRTLDVVEPKPPRQVEVDGELVDNWALVRDNGTDSEIEGYYAQN